MNFVDIMQSYFRGEHIESLAFVLPVGAALVAMAVVAVRAERGGFAWGMAIPLGLFGLLFIIASISIGMRTPNQVAQLERGYQADPAAMLAEELPRMQKVNANWPIYITTWTVLVLLGVATRFGVKADWGHGLGPALILIGAVGFVIDGFAERRAIPYTAALEDLAKEHGSAPSTND